MLWLKTYMIGKQIKRDKHLCKNIVIEVAVCSICAEIKKQTKNFRIIFSSIPSILESVQTEMQIFSNRTAEVINNWQTIAYFSVHFNKAIYFYLPFKLFRTLEYMSFTSGSIFLSSISPNNWCFDPTVKIWITTINI